MILVRTVHCWFVWYYSWTVWLAYWPERFTLYAPVRCHTVGTVVREEDRRVYLHGALYGGDNCWAGAVCWFFYRTVLCCETMFSHYCFITQELILNKLSTTCEDHINFVVSMFATFLYVCLYVCIYVPWLCTNKIIIIPRNGKLVRNIYMYRFLKT